MSVVSEQNRKFLFGQSRKGIRDSYLLTGNVPANDRAITRHPALGLSGACLG